jgi:putative ABC transport system permease protein
LQGNFPYYGTLEKPVPVQAGSGFKKGKYALVDKTLMLQFNAKVNDSIKVGHETFVIAGLLNKLQDKQGFRQVLRLLCISLCSTWIKPG